MGIESIDDLAIFLGVDDFGTEVKFGNKNSTGFLTMISLRLMLAVAFRLQPSNLVWSQDRLTAQSLRKIRSWSSLGLPIRSRLSSQTELA